jgi:hypothetical protein
MPIPKPCLSRRRQSTFQGPVYTYHQLAPPGRLTCRYSMACQVGVWVEDGRPWNLNSADCLSVHSLNNISVAFGVSRPARIKISLISLIVDRSPRTTSSLLASVVPRALASSALALRPSSPESFLVPRFATMYVQSNASRQRST